MKLKLFAYCFFFFLFSCKVEKEERFVKCSTEILADKIEKVNIDRGMLSMKSLYHQRFVLSWCPLIYKDSFPSWIEDHGEPDYYFKKYKFEPLLSDIEAPYILFKERNSCYFHIVKNNDTLKFKIENQ